MSLSVADCVCVCVCVVASSLQATTPPSQTQQSHTVSMSTKGQSQALKVLRAATQRSQKELQRAVTQV